jgi:coenzyme F420-0:L-glutamate ligase / coenzyme F420-1:gamma-L-glutamate ligase
LASLHIHSLSPLPEVHAGDDLAALIVAAMTDDGDGHPLTSGHVLAIAHKVVSKAEGATVALADVQASARAQELAAAAEAATGQPRDPRAVQVVLDQSAEIVRAERGVLICRTHHGFVCANAGVDASNAPPSDGLGDRTTDNPSTPDKTDDSSASPETGAEDGILIFLPRDPDASARALRSRLHELTGASPAVLITDSFGRAWRHGQCDVAIGCAGMQPLDDWRGRTDSAGRELHATWLAVTDAAAAAADLARAKDSREPVVVIAGLERFVTPEDGPGAAALIRPLQEDLFR